MRRIHLSQSITGPLRNWHLRDWAKATKWIKKQDGSSFSPLELKDAFLAHLEQGHICIPVGDCDNFDYKKGCLGHEIPDNEPPKP